MGGWYTMKITNWSIIFALLFISFIFIIRVKDEHVTKANDLSLRYDTALTAAVEDSAKMLLLNTQQEYESGYHSPKFMKVNRTEAIDAFFKTLTLNFGNENESVTQGIIKGYIPLILIVDYKGFYVYAMDEYRNAENELITDMKEMPFQAYSYRDKQGNLLNFTLDDYVIAYDKSQDKWMEGFREEIAGQLNIPLLKDQVLFEDVRRSTILNAIQDQTEYYINRHNTYAKRFGITYTFTLPIISEEDWENTIDDVGLISFIQGYPLGEKYTYNNYALGGSRLIKKASIQTTTLNGIKYYYREDCEYSYSVEEVFTSAKDAAKKGYKPLSCFNQ